MTSLRLSPEDKAEHAAEWKRLRDCCIRETDPVKKKIWRQQLSALYRRFAHRQLPSEPTPRSFGMFELELHELCFRYGVTLQCSKDGAIMVSNANNLAYTAKLIDNT